MVVVLLNALIGQEREAVEASVAVGVVEGESLVDRVVNEKDVPEKGGVGKLRDDRFRVYVYDNIAQYRVIVGKDVSQD